MMHTTRRSWLKLATRAAGSVAVGAILGGDLAVSRGTPPALAADVPVIPPAKPKRWEIGCFNRPWGRWTFDEALDGIKAAGFRTLGLLGDHKGEPFTLPEASADYLNRLHERIESRGLAVVIGWLRTAHDIPLADSIRRARQQIDHARTLKAKFMLTAGVDAPDQFKHFFQVMADAAAYAQDRQIEIVLKPHGGCSAAADEILRCLEQVNHPNFRVWFDAGNIIHYTGKDPVAEVERIAKHVTGFCAKDCPGPKGEVMLPFGAGKVDFRGVFAKLKANRFAGPVLVECCGGATLAEVTAGAKANREFLEKTIDTL